MKASASPAMAAASTRASPSAKSPTAKASSAFSRSIRPNIDSIKVIRRGKVRRAKLYYLRDRRGKSARIAEKMESPAAKAARKSAKKETKAAAKVKKAGAACG